MGVEDYKYLDYEGDYYIIKSSGLFDFEWYSNEYCVNNSEDPIKHFLNVGCQNNYKPNHYFDMEGYLKENTDVKNANINPFVHYIKNGKKEERFLFPFSDLKYKEDYFTILKSDLFDKVWFCNQYSIDENVDPIYYYLINGVELGLNPTPDFDTKWYLEEYYDDVKNKNMNPFAHYIKYGLNEGKLPFHYIYDSEYKEDYFTILKSDLFDKVWFCNQYSIDENVDPIYYYLINGVELGLNPTPDFDTKWYLEEYYDDVKKAL